MSNIILVNADKKKRAEDIFALLGKTPKSEGDASLKERHLELLKEDGIDVKDKEISVVSIYKRLGGIIRTEEEQAKIVKARVGRPKKFARVEKDEEKVEDTDEDE